MSQHLEFSQHPDHNPVGSRPLESETEQFHAGNEPFHTGDAPAYKNGGLDTDPPSEKDMQDLSEKPGVPRSISPDSNTFQIPIAWRERCKAEYSGAHKGETLPPGTDVERVIDALFTMDTEQSVAKLRDLIEQHRTDRSFMSTWMDHIKLLVEGPEAAGMNYDDWSYDCAKTAGLLYNWSPYPEVRAVTTPYDDVDEPCETIRAYFLGFFWLIGVTCINTFFAPRQPGIQIPGSLVQLLLVPMGQFCAKVLPDWGFTMFGTRYSLNPGPWSAKEQLLATIIESAAGSGNFGGLLAMRMPQFFNQKWVRFGFEVCLGIANQVFGLGAAGLFRRLTVYPSDAVWPAVLPTLALNRTLVFYDNKRENINGWRMSRWLLFMFSSLIFLIWYWVPNNLMVALQRFDWMAWIKPNNFNLNIVTGGYGGMGFNPISTFDPNYSGSAAMNSPFFAQFQQYILRVLGGVILLALYYSNYAWAAYMPINSGSTFTNTGDRYNTSMVLNENNVFSEENYHNYSPPYYSISQVFKTGGEFAFYTITITYVFIIYWGPIVRAFKGIYTNFKYKRSGFTGHDDAQSRMMRMYPEVPEWWFGCILIIGFICSVITMEYWPTQTPWWSILAFVGIGYFLLIPWAIVESIAATGIAFDSLWHLLPGLWWPGKLIPQLVIVMLGSAFEIQAGAFMQDLKMTHYAHIPPRAVFRGHTLSIIVNVFFYVIMIDWMVTGYNNKTFCDQDDPTHMVCQWPRETWSKTIFYGVFGTTRMFKMYPILPWCFLIGAIIGIVWAVSELMAPKIRARCKERMTEASYEASERFFFRPVGKVLGWINPAIALSGMLQWSNNNNLTMATTGIYIAWFFQHYLKKKYTAWWSKYAYMCFAGLSVGITISGLISTLVFSFGAGAGKSIKWWGNNPAAGSINYYAFQDLPQGALLQVANGSYFGVDKAHYP